MANKTMISFEVEDEFKDRLDAAVEKLELTDRSKFIRWAIDNAIKCLPHPDDAQPVPSVTVHQGKHTNP